jgi:DNA-directed RNA polymerase II subunit RPB1
MEMNVHAPQSLQTRNELIQLASVPTQIITPKDSKPIISIVQDVALGVYRISKSFITITEKQMMNLMCPNPRFSGILPQPAMVEGKIKMWSGRQALSSTLPSNVNFKGANNSYDDKNGEDKENYVVIESGEIKQGRLDTKVYQDRTRGLVHSIFNEYGPEETRHFFDNTQQLICNWLVLNGFSVGISDLVVDNATNQSLDKIIHDMKVKVYDVIRDIHMKKFNNESILSDHDKFEEDVNKLLNDAIQQAGKVGLEKIDDVNNRMINMIKAGAKGNTVNISQMIACLGQQNIDGKRVAYGFESRTLPHYTKYDDGPEARGFVESSFIKGLTPQEFFFHSMGGREGLIDTAVKTSATGYIQRKLVKAMEDCKVSYDMTVRNANGNIIQFLYGEDGIDAIKIESQPLHYISMSMDKMENEYMISSKDDLSSAILPNVIDDMHKQHPSWQDRILEHYKQLHADRDFFINRLFRGVQENSIMYPVSFTRIINNTLVLRQRFGMGKILTDMSPIFVLDEVQKLCNDVRVSPNNKGTKLFEMLARMYL